MEITLADNAGFCFGVRRAIQIAIKASKENHKKIYTLGPIIHNPQMVKRLEESGIFVIQEIEQLKEGDTIIIRSHGVTFETIQWLEEKKINIIDATCPFVKSAQSHARELDDEGYKVVVVGEKNHPEVIGIVSFAKNGAIVVNHDDDISGLFKSKKIGIVAQTTIQHKYLDKIVCTLLPQIKELRIFNTICSTTVKRQDSTKKLAKSVDAIVVVGGYNSANTNRLANICKEMDKPTFHIETAQELVLDEFANFENIGVTAGASTPDWIIEDVIQKLETLNVTFKQKR